MKNLKVSNISSGLKNPKIINGLRYYTTKLKVGRSVKRGCEFCCKGSSVDLRNLTSYYVRAVLKITELRLHFHKICYVLTNAWQGIHIQVNDNYTTVAICHLVRNGYIQMYIFK
jgi:hypothetical protein